MKKLLLPILLINFLFCTSCKKDTCNAALGDTFLNIETPIFDQNNPEENVFNANMQTMNELTEAYFEATTIIANNRDRFGNDWQNDDEIVEEIKFQKSNFLIKFKQIDLVDYGEIALHFRLRDRKEFIDCDHGGSGDTYFLNIQFSVIIDQNGERALTDFRWEEEFRPGPY